MGDFMTIGEAGLPAKTSNSGPRCADDWTYGETDAVTGALVDLRTAAIGWDDIQGPALNAGNVAAVTVEAFGDTSWQCVHYRHDQDDLQFFQFQLPHRWNRGEVRMHAHVVPMANPVSAQVVKLSGRYAWAKYGVAVPAWADWTTFDVPHTVGTTDALKPTIVSLFSTTPTSPKESDFLLVYFTRQGATDSEDTYTTSKSGGTAAANLAVLNLDAHFLAVKAGTTTEVPT